ncbi:hypothetical protein [Psychrobacter sp. DAB_AL32B]
MKSEMNNVINNTFYFW